MLAFWSGIYLDGHFGVKSLLTEGASVQVVGVHVQQVFLQLIRLEERLMTRLAAVLGRGRHQMHRHVMIQLVDVGEGEVGRTVRAKVARLGRRRRCQVGALRRRSGRRRGALAPTAQIGGCALRRLGVDALVVSDAGGQRRRLAVEFQHVGQTVHRQRVLL